MVVKCIDNAKFEHKLIVGEVYTVKDIESEPYYYELENGDWFDKGRFEIIKELDHEKR